MDESISSQSYNDGQYLEYKEPQITSADPNERKLARSLRIDRRVENLRRQNMPEGEEVEQKVVEKTMLQQQLEKSAEVLEKLMTEGQELVSNVRVANDSREVDRREEEGIGREKIIEKLEEEASLAIELFNEIANKWSDILKNNDPLQIHDDMSMQKEKCEELVKQKDGIIAMLREEIRNSERKFTNDQYKQNEDIQTLAKRIEKQIKLMRKSYRKEMEFIEEIIMEERKLLIDANDKKWEELYKKRENEEKNQCEKKFEQQEDFVQEMNKLRIEHQEKYRESKIKLENEVEELHQELERIKTMTVMNSEKLDYNYQILRKREDENLIINSQQKRRINKLQDIINNLRKRNQEYDGKTKTEIERLTGEVMKMQKCVVEIEHKAVSLSKINDLKYKQVWDLNVTNANAVLNKILTIDKILHEQQLGVEWRKPDTQILRKRDLESYKLGMEAVDAENKDQLKKEKELLESRYSESNSKLYREKSEYRNILRHILQQISGKAGFLIEERLNAILDPYLTGEKTMITMDNVFTALGVKEEDDIMILVHFFLPYVKCMICSKLTSSTLKSSVDHVSSGLRNSEEYFCEGASIGTAAQEVFDQMMDTVNQPDDVISNIVREAVGAVDNSESSSSGDTISTSNSTILPEVLCEKNEESLYNVLKGSQHLIRLSCKNNHPLQINPIFVIRALREFITKFYVDTSGVESLATRLSQKHTTVSRIMTSSDVKMFWDRYRNVFTEGRQKLWEGLFFGLQKYYEILKDRRKVNDEVMCLRRQNAELKHLLGKYAKEEEGRRPPCAEQREIPIRDTKLNSCKKS